jgi:hypothetical protein
VIAIEPPPPQAQGVDGEQRKRRPSANWSCTKCLGVMDRFTRECLALEVDTSLTDRRVVAVLNLRLGIKPEAVEA